MGSRLDRVVSDSETPELRLLYSLQSLGPGKFLDLRNLDVSMILMNDMYLRSNS